MSQILLTLLILLTNFVSQAATFSTDVTISRSRDIVHRLNVTCSLGEEFCDLLCQNQASCVIEQKSCVDCVSQTYRLFKTIFTELNQTFVARTDQGASTSDLIEFLRHERWMVLSHDSFYNAFTPEHIEKNKFAFNSMCPGSSRRSDTLLIVKLDSANRPENISHVICQSESGTSAYGVQFHPELTDQAMAVQPVLRVEFRP